MLEQTASTSARQAAFNPAVVLDTVKQAEDSRDLIVRLYESHGIRGRLKLSTTLPVRKATRCNFLEEEEKPMSRRLEFHIAPFQIITLKLRLAT